MRTPATLSLLTGEALLENLKEAVSKSDSHSSEKINQKSIGKKKIEQILHIRLLRRQCAARGVHRSPPVLP